VKDCRSGSEGEDSNGISLYNLERLVYHQNESDVLAQRLQDECSLAHELMGNDETVMLQNNVIIEQYV